MDLERNLIDNILECEIKLGHASSAISFYYPMSSLIELLNCENESLEQAIAEFQTKEAQRLGKVVIKEVTDEKGRYGVKIPAEGVNWVHDHYAPTDFMQHFISQVHKREQSLEDMRHLFLQYSTDVVVEKITETEWAIRFTDETIDPYVYCIEKNDFGLEYHRFTKMAYVKTIRE